MSYQYMIFILRNIKFYAILCYKIFFGSPLGQKFDVPYLGQKIIFCTRVQNWGQIHKKKLFLAQGWPERNFIT